MYRKIEWPYKPKAKMDNKNKNDDGTDADDDQSCFLTYLDAFYYFVRIIPSSLFYRFHLKDLHARK